MDKQNRKRQRGQEEEDNNTSNGSMELSNNNGNDAKELINFKMAVLEAKSQILEEMLKNHKLMGQINALREENNTLKIKDAERSGNVNMDEFVRNLASLEEQEQIQIAELKGKFQEQNEAIKETFIAVQANAEKEKNRLKQIVQRKQNRIGELTKEMRELGKQLYQARNILHEQKQQRKEAIVAERTENVNRNRNRFSNESTRANAHGSWSWFALDLIVHVRSTFSNESLFGHEGTVRSIEATGCLVYFDEIDEGHLIKFEFLVPVRPVEGDQAIVIAGSRKGELGTVISVEGDEGIMQSSVGVRLYHVPSLCKSC